jgi:hypothetical protein
MLMRVFILCVMMVLCGVQANAQKDSVAAAKKAHRPNIFKRLAKNIFRDTAVGVAVRSDLRFQKYKGRIIRNIIADKMVFGSPETDTSKKLIKKLTKLANKLHRNTRPNVVMKNLFFDRNDPLDPYMMADNERYLRDLSYINDCRIIVLPVKERPDSVDILVLTKDVFSLAGSVSSFSPTNTELGITEDNINGTGNRSNARALYDKSRRNPLGYSLEYLQRNIGGSFIDLYGGYSSYAHSITGFKEEDNFYIRLVRPLVNPYVHWIYAAELSEHNNKNRYWTDSLFLSDQQYKYYNADAWAGYNFNAQLFSRKKEENRFRGLLAARYVSNKFAYVPDIFKTTYNWRYYNLNAFLASFTLFRQDFFKTQYFFGFGRNEDIPEGINMSITGGATNKQNRSRPYAGLEFKRYYFNSKDRYVDYTLRFGGFLYKSRMEDINALANLTKYSNLKELGHGWRVRNYIQFSVAGQINKVLNDPIFLRNSFGLQEFDNGSIEGMFRATVKYEKAVYTPWSLISFRFAPFVFANASLFTPDHSAFRDSRLYPSIGGGIRTRNESLIFGTFELKGYYFPVKNVFNKNYRVEVTTNLRFRYITDFVKRPDFVQVN